MRYETLLLFVLIILSHLSLSQNVCRNRKYKQKSIPVTYGMDVRYNVTYSCYYIVVLLLLLTNG